MNKEDKKILFLGPKTSYTDIAKEKFKQYYGISKYKDDERRTITAILSELAKTKNNLAVLPIENAIEGVVVETIDNLAKLENSDIKILAECIIPIEHCLVGYSDDITKIDTITSHPQAISQCFNYIYKKFEDDIEYKPESSTAKAIMTLSKDEPNIAAIGSEFSAKTYNKPIIDRNINDTDNNKTRFILLGNIELPSMESEYKTSIYFSTQNKSGALCEILQILQEYDINMTNITSRPSKKGFGEYCFYIDFDGKITDEKISKAIIKIIQKVAIFKHLGTYQILQEI